MYESITCIQDLERDVLHRPDNYANWGDTDYHTHWPFIGQHRDSDSLDRSNFATAWEMIEPVSGDEEDAYIGSDSHFLVGWVEHIFVRVRGEDGQYTPAFRQAYEIVRKLADYPVLDEEHYSEVEYEEACEILRSYDIPEEDIGEVLSEMMELPRENYGRYDDAMAAWEMIKARKAAGR